MKEINLTKGFVTKVDDEDYPNLIGYKWLALKNGKYGQYYAIRVSSKAKHIPMHSMLIERPQGMQIDHIDGDSLNNQKSNLRIATHSQNGANRKMNNNKKGVQYLGVYQVKNGKRFFGICRKDKIVYHTGYFDNVKDAVLARNKLNVKLHGEFAALSIYDPNKLLFPQP